MWDLVIKQGYNLNYPRDSYETVFECPLGNVYLNIPQSKRNDPLTDILPQC